MAKFRVTTAQLRNKANELENLKTQFQNQVTALREGNTRLGGEWKGDARTQFDMQFQKDAQQFDQFAEGIGKYIAQLRKDADDYDEAERRNAELAASRK